MIRRLLGRLKRTTAPISNRTDLINHALAYAGGGAYLEIGVRDRRDNFDKIRATTKHGVDPAPRRPVSHPMTSDEFFAKHDGTRYDVVFIDGLHQAQQVHRDVENSLKVLLPGGAIVIHDCNPLTRDAQTEDYDGKKHWNGTVWKAWVGFRATHANLSMCVVDIDEGCGVIRVGSQSVLAPKPPEMLDFDYLRENRSAVLNLVSVDAYLSALAVARGPVAVAVAVGG